MWKIKHIFDGDYGCEERSESENPKVTVTLVNENNEKKIISVEDKWLMDNNLDEGDESHRSIEYASNQVSRVRITIAGGC